MSDYNIIHSIQDDTIKLSIPYQLIAKDLAKERYTSNRCMGIVDRKIGNQSSEMTDLNGVAAEIGFCLMFELQFDRTISPRSGTPDCYYKGYSVDVKTTIYKRGKLLATLKKKLDDAEIYVLMIGDFPEYLLAGWAWNSELINEDNIGQIRGVRTYLLRQSELRTTDELRRLVNKNDL